MKRFSFQFALQLAVLALAVVGVSAQAGQNVSGTIFNMTSGAPLAHVALKLLQLTGNMPTVANAVSDGQGRYRFSENAEGPFMVEADFQGVPYFAKVQDGQSETNVQVYDAISDAALLKVGAEIMVLQPDQGQLAIVNEYRIENGVQPPKTLFAPSGMFRFRVPPGANVDMVRVVGPGELPLSRTARPAGAPGLFSVNSPLRPGETRIQVSYRVPYSGLKAALSESPAIPPDNFEVYVPSPMTFSGTGFAQVGAQAGYTVYGAEPANGSLLPTTLNFQVSGDAPMPAAAAGAQPGGDGATTGADGSAAAGSDAGGAGGSDAGAGSGTASPAPGPAASVPAPTFIERNLWTVLALLGLAAAAGFGILMARPETAVAAAAPTVTILTHAALPAAPVNALSIDLARLRDDLFLLEVRRHVHDVSDADYVRLRAEIDVRMDRLAGK